MKVFFYESEESEMERGRGLLRWSVVKGIVFSYEPHMSMCVFVCELLFYFIQVVGVFSFDI